MSNKNISQNFRRGENFFTDILLCSYFIQRNKL